MLINTLARFVMISHENRFGIRKIYSINSNCLVKIANGMLCAKLKWNFGKMKWAEMKRKRKKSKRNSNMQTEDRRRRRRWLKQKKKIKKKFNVKISVWKFAIQCVQVHVLLLLLSSLNGWCVFRSGFVLLLSVAVVVTVAVICLQALLPWSPSMKRVPEHTILVFFVRV